MKEVHLHVDGIMCNNCVRKVKADLKKLSGVNNVSVSPNFQMVSLAVEENKVTLTQIKQVIETIEGKSFKVIKQM